LALGWIAAAAAMVLAAGLGTWWLYWRNSPEHAFQLLAQAYTEKRMIELRYPSAAWGRLRVERGSSSASSALPAMQLEGEARIARALNNDPENGDWLLRSSYAALLHGDYGHARKTLEPLQQEPAFRHLATIGLGMSWFESAEKELRASDYAQAAELFSSALHNKPGDPSALFNLALTFERLQSPEKARQTWEELLRVEPKGGWSSEAKSHLDALRTKINRRQLSTPEQDAAALEPGQPPVFEKLRAAFAQDSTGHLRVPKEVLFLGQRFSSRYGDYWLVDLLTGFSEQTRPALQALVDAQDASRRGDPDAAIRLAGLAKSGFEKTGNTAGAQRASYEILYGFQRSSRPEDCLRTGTALTASIDRAHSPWLYSQALLDLAGCANMSSRFELSDRFTAESIKQAEDHGFHVLEMRGLGIRAATLSMIGRWEQAWQLDIDGLNRFWEGHYPPERAYQFYYDMSASAEAHGAYRIARDLAEEATTYIAMTGNISVEALARARLAHLDLELQDSGKATDQLSSAEKLFQRLGGGRAMSLYRADTEIGFARMDVLANHAGAALRRLRWAGENLKGFGNRPEALLYLRALVDAEQENGDARGKEQALRALIVLAEAALPSLNTEQDRVRWTHELDQGYRGLVSSLVGRDEVWQALDAWQWYRAAGYRTQNPGASQAKPGSDPLSISASELVIPTDWVRRAAGESAGATHLTFVQLPTGVAEWVYDEQQSYFHWIPIPAGRAKSMVRRFVNACSDPSSSAAVVRTSGEAIYKAFLLPLMGHLKPGRTLIVQADGPVATAPLRALPDSPTTVLGDKFPIVFTPGGPSNSSGNDDIIDMSDIAVAVGSPFIGPTISPLFPALPDASDEARETAAVFPHHTLLIGESATREAIQRALLGARVFHFAGHAVSTAGRTGLLAPDAGDKDWEDALWDPSGEPALSHCSLVVLSACETSPMTEWGASDPDSLPRALLSRGVRRVVASRWPVESQATRTLMRNFYQALQQGKPVPAALLAASAQIRQASETSHPYYWASFEVFR
jgi:CHAT domain-containing protein/tetratricopeptide (TPR) repeat protein